MPDDNSCMFTAFGGAVGINDPSRLLRQQVAEYITLHPDEYNKAILGDEPARYIARMQQADTWGGAIELSILSDIYDIEISSIDVKVSVCPTPLSPGARRQYPIARDIFVSVLMKLRLTRRQNHSVAAVPPRRQIR